MSRPYIIGIDEVGRGPLAGPVVVCALALSPSANRQAQRASHKTMSRLKDSKKLNVKQREAWFNWLKNSPDIHYSVARVYPRGIERLNISAAANLAATRAFLKVCGALSLEHSRELTTKVYLDGGLYLRVSPRDSRRWSVTTVVRGDQKFNAVKLASIVAKVTRDVFMNRMHQKFPDYGFDVHKGYGTKSHIAALKKYGPCPAHRTTFIGNFV